MVQITRRTALAGAAALALGSAPAAHAQAKPKLRFSCAFTETDCAPRATRRSPPR